jgi:hypothetical protein
MNRDTLYSGAVFDLDVGPVTITTNLRLTYLPDLEPLSTQIGYLTTLGLRGCDGSGAAGESAKVAQTVKPSGRFSGAKSR